MDARFYNSEDIDVERLAKDLVNAYMMQGYQAQYIGNRDQMLVQIKKGGDFEAIIGMQAALSLTIQRTTGGVLAMIGQQRWIDKAAVGAVGVVALPILWPLALTAGVGALRQASLGNQVLNMVDGLVRQQKPEVGIGPVPAYLMPQVQQQMSQQPPAQTPMYVPSGQPHPAPAPAPPPAPFPGPGGLRCSNCNTPYEPGDTFCTGCGRPLAQPRQYCSKCNAELKPGIAFCPRCGASTYHPAQQPQPAPPPTPAPRPTVTYTPAAPAQPAPAAQSPQPPQAPPQPQRPPTPVYTPPPQPQTPVYTPPQPPQAPPQPQRPPAPAKPAEPLYVPPVTQTPPVAPQPKVTYVPAEQKKDQPATPPQRPQKQYYVPSNQATQATQAQQASPAQSAQRVQQAQPDQQAQQAQPEEPYYVPSQTVQATPAAQPQDQGMPWGELIFSNGEQVQLKGERAVVGRFDNDISGIKPEVDLSKMPDADTVSRIHAVIEHDNGTFTLTDLNSTNLTRLNGKRLEPDKATPISDGDTLRFGKVECTFRKI